MAIHEIYEEFAICRWKNGIRLLPPKEKFGSLLYRSRVQDALNLPFNTFFVDTESKLCNANTACLINMGAISLQDVLKKSMKFISPRKCAQQLMQQDKQSIINKEQVISNDTITFLKKDIVQHYLSIRFPWYDNHDQVIGVFGCSILLDSNPLAECLTQIKNLGVFDSYPNHLSQQLLGEREICGIPLTKRESEFLYQTIRGKTAKEIAKLYGISFRTVEEKIQELKYKLNVNSKNALVEKVLDFFI